MKPECMLKFFHRLSGTMITAVLFCLFLWTTGVLPAHSSALLERQTAQGPVIGVSDSATETISWKAIPYAKPPVGNLRWKAPVMPEKRSAPLNADTFCQICPQYINHDRNPETPQIIYGKEDCLYMNIWAPENVEAGADLPVFFWIHGGGNSIQWPLLSMQNGGFLAQRGNMVVVTFNYRLGPMGFLNHPAIKTGDKADDSGNFATLDQIAALKWVQSNIKSFGGNPDNVTIAGESAGGQNVFCLVSSPLAKGLFHRAVSQSGVIRPSSLDAGTAHATTLLEKLLVKDKKAADQTAAKAILEKMSKDQVKEYMLSKTASDFLALYPGGPVRGMIRFPSAYEDGHVLPEDFYAVLNSGKYNKVPMIMGTNKEEVKLFLRSVPPFNTWRADKSLFTDPSKMGFFTRVAAYQSDGWKAMGVDEPARIMRRHKDQPQIFAYQFLWGAGGVKNSVMSMPFNVLLGSCHAMEIDFVFGTQKASLGALVFNEKNKPGRVALSSAMMDYWSQFARNGNPNPEGAKLPEWAAWTNDNGPKSLLLDADYETLQIRMSDKEVTTRSIESELKADPLQPKIQPYWDQSVFRRR